MVYTVSLSPRVVSKSTSAPVERPIQFFCCALTRSGSVSYTHLIKRRTVANEACDAGRVLVNGKPARASYDVKVGDVLEIQMGSHPLKAEVLDVTEYAKKETASQLYRLL